MFENPAETENKEINPSKLERRSSQVSAALKQKFENPSSTTYQKEKSSSRDSFEIPEGVIRRSKNNIFNPQGSLDGSAGGGKENWSARSIFGTICV